MAVIAGRSATERAALEDYSDVSWRNRTSWQQKDLSFWRIERALLAAFQPPLRIKVLGAWGFARRLQPSASGSVSCRCRYLVAYQMSWTGASVSKPSEYKQEHQRHL